MEKKKLKIGYTWCMGGISFLLFIVLTISGILLMFYYRPTIEHAYHDMKDLEFGITFGLFYEIYTAGPLMEWFLR